MKKGVFFNAKRLITSIIAFTLIFSISSVSVYAATVDADFYGTVYKDVAAVYGENGKSFQTHYDQYGEMEGRSANVEDAIKKKDIRSLLVYFLAKNADYYRENALKPGFKFFNADKYLKANPDVAKAVDNNKAAALEHYLMFGALEGRGCGTIFDPVIAITVMPDGALLSPGQLVESWVKLEGKASTEDYYLHVNFNAPVPLVYTATKLVNNNTLNTSSSTEQKNSDSNNSAPSPAPVVNKTFTLLAYVCGSDLESGAGRMEATKAIVKILLGAYNEDNANVLLLAGGSDEWKNGYLQNLLGGQDNGVNKSAIFKVDKVELSAAIAKLIADVDGWDSVDDIYETVDSYDKRRENKELFKIIVEDLLNEKTMPVLGDSLGTNKMGDSATLVSLLKEGTCGEYKADNYALTLWNHGGGSMEGVCFPDDETGGLTILDIKNALEEAGFGSTNSSKEYKLGLLAFDACLMAGVENAAYLSDYYDIMYASEETTYGDIDYYHLLQIANQKVNNADLSMELAMAVFMDRSENYLGTDDSLATSALIKSGMAAGAIEKLNDLAIILRDKAASNDNIYAAIKNARLKCEQFDAARSSFDAGKEYVDMKNFLQLLIRELMDYQIIDESPSIVRKAIEDAIDATDLATYANAYNYGNRRVFCNINGSDVYVNSDFWEDLKDMDLCGVNMFVPYYSKDDSTVQSYLSSFDTIYAESLLLGDYNALVKEYVLYLDSDKVRVEKLTQSLIKGYEYDESIEGNVSIPGYADLINMSLEKSGGRDYLSIVMNKYENNYYSQYSSGDAFVDFCETMDSMLVYITRKATAMCEIGGVKTENDYYVDIVVGSKTIYYENLNGLKNAVNIFTDQFDDINMNIVGGDGWSETGTNLELCEVFDFIMPSDLEGFTEKDSMVEKLRAYLDDKGDYDDSKWMSAKGTARTALDTEAIPVYHLFKMGEDGFYEYKGSVKVSKDYKVGDVVNNARYITFYHQVVDPSTNRLGYAEELSWEYDNENMINVAKLYGTKVYDILGSNNGIVMGSVGIEIIGSSNDNGYYFAVSQDATTNLDDVFANVSAKGSNYDNADIFANVDASMNAIENSSENTDSANKVTPETPEIQKEMVENSVVNEDTPDESGELPNEGEDISKEEIEIETLDADVPDEITEPSDIPQ